ncbi:hypothetical protein D0Y50_13275 [Salinimonas sediminis]|uniref:Uncharacterized protein n=2 Tax=Salinimonas sediminis TaxID=2303538 RepID=A0A346NNX7_9ALTE|nr:hypothetical protein D0Y50_13275 [Salinimonas sediminis]
MCYRHLVFCAVFFSAMLSFTAQAADRGHYMPHGMDDKIALQSELPSNWQAQLAKGEVLDVELFRQGRVVYRDASNGLVALRLENKLVRMVEQTREIVDVLNSI